jgi:hypothetical protein
MLFFGLSELLGFIYLKIYFCNLQWPAPQNNDYLKIQPVLTLHRMKPEIPGMAVIAVFFTGKVLGHPGGWRTWLSLLLKCAANLKKEEKQMKYGAKVL